MQKSLFLLFLTTILCSVSIGQIPKCDTIFWRKTAKLSWSDFKGKPDTFSIFGAITFGSVGYKARQEGDSIYVTTYCGFLCWKSWTRYYSSTGLNHEQTHFNIFELYRRLFIKNLRTTAFSKNNSLAIVEEIFQNIKRQRDAFTKKYDQETDFSRNEVQQSKWSRDVLSKLKELEGFSDNDILMTSR